MNTKTKRKNIFLILFLSLIISSFLFSLYFFNFLGEINNKINDNFYGNKNALNNIIILSIDDKSINQIGRWPWDRSVFYEILDKLEKENSKVIGIDVGFFENSTPEQDIKLNSFLEKKKNIILGCEYTSFENKKDLIHGKEILLPIFNLSNDQTGYVNVNIDNDGVVRSVNLNIVGDYSSFDTLIYEKYKGKFLENSRLKNPSNFLINFNKPNSFKSCSVIDFLDNNCEIDFNNKIVLIGATSKDLHDDFLVPTSNGKKMSGVEVHANIIQTLLLKNELSKISNFLFFILLFLTSLIITYFSFNKRILFSLILSLSLFLLYSFLSLFLFEKFYVIINLFYIQLTIVISFVSDIIIKYFSEKKKKVLIENLFGKYVAPPIVRELMKDSSKLKLGGEQKKITILFSDIESFTTLSEQMTPQQVVKFLNTYLNKMSEIIFKNKGIIDKYIGDAIMAFWGAPISQKNQIELACKTALEMVSLKKELQKETGIKNLNFRIGINYGDAVVGNLGSSKRMNYTIIGDSVNVASRLEGTNKEFKTNIIVSHSVYEKVKNKFIFRYLGEVKVKGKKEKIKIYELVNFKK